MDTLAALAEFGRREVEVDRRQALGAAVYSAADLVLPTASWWEQMAQRSGAHPATSTYSVGWGDVEAVREGVALFSRIDQRRGGGHARSAVVQYLTSDVASYLHGSYAQAEVRRAMFSAAGELAYLAGWMAFDDGQHARAHAGFKIGLQLAAEADDPALAAHILRAMAHQALDLGHIEAALNLSDASMQRRRYANATPRERALIGVIYARAQSAAGYPRQAAVALLRAEDDLSSASRVDNEPNRVFFFGEASLAHETGCALRDGGDLDGALREFKRSVATRKSASFTRTHAVTLGYLGTVHARRGSLEEACAAWAEALDVADGIRSARVRTVVSEMRSNISQFHGTKLSTATAIDIRAGSFLANSS
ncbi:Tat pathway signal protein [Parafrankia discariae]|uniref:Tat pathway signal protein n=1 Tax=Parafrankia discariae TaxID=365528 RepID=UPI0003A3FC38|nr:Tat pathway signal protein [Parafrankia discariae]